MPYYASQWASRRQSSIPKFERKLHGLHGLHQRELLYTRAATTHAHFQEAAAAGNTHVRTWLREACVAEHIERACPELSSTSTTRSVRPAACPAQTSAGVSCSFHEKRGASRGFTQAPHSQGLTEAAVHVPQILQELALRCKTFRSRSIPRQHIEGGACEKKTSCSLLFPTSWMSKFLAQSRSSDTPPTVGISVTGPVGPESLRSVCAGSQEEWAS